MTISAKLRSEMTRNISSITSSPENAPTNLNEKRIVELDKEIIDLDRMAILDQNRIPQAR